MKLLHFRTMFRCCRGLWRLAASLGMAACVVAPPPRTVMVPTPPPPKVFIYPSNGQTQQQMDMDRYECHTWAVQQTGVDPSRQSPYQQVVVQPAPPPGSATAAGAVTGAVVGSIAAGPYNSGAGFLTRCRRRRHHRLGRGRQCPGEGQAGAAAGQSSRGERASRSRGLPERLRDLPARARLYRQVVGFLPGSGTAEPPRRWALA